MKKSFSPPFEEFYFRHSKPSLSSLGQTSPTYSPNEPAAPVAAAEAADPLPLLETGARSKNQNDD